MTSDTGLVGNVLCTSFGGGSYLNYHDDTFQYFNGTHWVQMSDAQLGGIILSNGSLELCEEKASSTTIREAIRLLKMICARDKVSTLHHEPPPVINVVNGELWILKDGSVELRPHNPASAQGFCLPVQYDPSATCPQYDGALKEIFSRSGDPSAMAAFWNELVGYVLQPARPEARVIVCWGNGGDGKSSLTSLLVDMLGPEQVAALPVGSLVGNRFAMSHLIGKRLLHDDDVAADIALPDGLIKTISERKVVTAERKFREPVTFQVRAMPILLCNSVPRLRDTSNGFRRRLTVIPFSRQFSPSEADRELFGRIKAIEMPGVLNRALAGLQRVVQRGWNLAPPELVIEVTDQWWIKATRSQTPTDITAPPKNVLSPKVHTSAAAEIEPQVHAVVGEAYDCQDLLVDLKGGRTCSVTIRTPGTTVRVRAAIKAGSRP